MNRAAVNTATLSQLHLPMFKPHEIAAYEWALRREIARQQASRQRHLTLWIRKKSRRSEALEQLDDSILDLPIGREDHELRGLVDPDADDKQDLEEISSSVQHWSDEAIEQLHEGVLMYSLRLLNARGNGKEKKQILSWIFDPQGLFFAEPIDTGSIQWKFIHASQVPFSFERCCRVVGYNAETLREGLVPTLKNLGLDALYKEIQHEQQRAQKERVEARSQTVPDWVDIQLADPPWSDGDGAGAGVAGRPNDRPLLCV